MGDIKKTIESFLNEKITEYKISTKDGITKMTVYFGNEPRPTKEVDVIITIIEEVVEKKLVEMLQQQANSIGYSIFKKK